MTTAKKREEGVVGKGEGAGEIEKAICEVILMSCFVNIPSLQ